MIYRSNSAAAEKVKLLKLTETPAASLPSASYARRGRSLRPQPLIAPVSLKFRGRWIITQTRRNL